MAFLHGPSVGLPLFFVDGSVLIASGVAIAIAGVPTLAELLPSLKAVSRSSPSLSRVAGASGLILLLYISYVATMLFALSRATDL